VLRVTLPSTTFISSASSSISSLSFSISLIIAHKETANYLQQIKAPESSVQQWQPPFKTPKSRLHQTIPDNRSFLLNKNHALKRLNGQDALLLPIFFIRVIIFLYKNWHLAMLF
jgi:hypothetical protein